MKKCYTISSVNDIQKLDYLDRVQFTLNGRITPDKRNTVKTLAKVNNEKTEIFVHCDFLTSVARYPISNFRFQKSLITELSQIIQYSQHFPNVRGIVMHTDSPFKSEMVKEMKSNPMTSESAKYYADKYYTSTYFADSKFITSLFTSISEMDVDFPFDIKCDDKSLEFCHKWYLFAYGALYQDLKKVLNAMHITNPKCKVYLENTTKVTHRLPPYDKNKPDQISTLFAPSAVAQLINTTKFYNDLFGFCYDLEHAFACGDIILGEPDFRDLVFLKRECPNLMIHMNCIEQGVVFGSFKDRHSQTTICECLNYPVKFYTELAKACDDLDIPFIREVKQPVMEAELEYLASNNI